MKPFFLSSLFLASAIFVSPVSAQEKPVWNWTKIAPETARLVVSAQPLEEGGAALFALGQNARRFEAGWQNPQPFLAGMTLLDLDFSAKNPTVGAALAQSQAGETPDDGQPLTPDDLARREARKASSTSVLRTRDGGKTWEVTHTVEQGSAGGQLAVSPLTPNRWMWVPASGAPLFSGDGGQSWNTANRENADETLPSPSETAARGTFLVADLAYEKADVFYYFDGATFFHSFDGGQGWSESQTPATWPSDAVPTLVSNPRKAGEVWLSFAGKTANQTFVSRDGGDSWNEFSALENVAQIAFGANDAGETPAMYALTEKGVSRSLDGGESWRFLGGPAEFSAFHPSFLSADGREAHTVFLADKSGIWHGAPGETERRELELERARQRENAEPDEETPRRVAT